MKSAASLRNSRGFTLIEVMAALVIMAVGMIGLLQALGIAFEHNLRNQMREEAVYMGEKYMNELRNSPFENLSTSYPSMSVTGSARGGTGAFVVDRSAPALSVDGTGATVRQLQVLVKWTYKGVQYQNRVISPVSRPLQ
ncbi:prepilin-type N-terminal cleavage/methylation domain-containing protein [Geomonas sp. RF6]|uniref:type IV pilus modification PilV family protein n=1 Tax=Geomonas sp. RF6 TaxID=2897342 RepID=UPI001E3AC2B4|nr:prepilin-type N-terminal cleavage/methylation domain-containing protein [Geomonas sp. RF6]UFS69640.1 prepilin-type N-terminal cleavage/methylation domain-containing protein [Geomonas sp. RF6]